jgi:hypothetical protein
MSTHGHEHKAPPVAETNDWTNEKQNERKEAIRKDQEELHALDANTDMKGMYLVKPGSKDTLGAVAMGLTGKGNEVYSMPVEYRSDKLKDKPNIVADATIYPDQWVYIEGDKVVVSDDPDGNRVAGAMTATGAAEEIYDGKRSDNAIAATGAAEEIYDGKRSDNAIAATGAAENLYIGRRANNRDRNKNPRRYSFRGKKNVLNADKMVASNN